MPTFNTLRPRQNGCHFADIFKCISLNENVWISVKISKKFIPKGPINNIPVLVQIMAWRRPGDKPLSEPMMASLLTHICVTRHQCALWSSLFHVIMATASLISATARSKVSQPFAQVIKASFPPIWWNYIIFRLWKLPELSFTPWSPSDFKAAVLVGGGLRWPSAHECLSNRTIWEKSGHEWNYIYTLPSTYVNTRL